MSSVPHTFADGADYAWELATLYPEQGAWSEGDYLGLTDGDNRRIELVDGRLEFLPMPTEIHEALTQFLLFTLYQFVSAAQLGKVYSTGIRLRVRKGKIRLPDVIFLHREQFHVRHNRAWDGATIAMEVVSDDRNDRKRDYEEKLADYAEANVGEYWIVDPEQRTVQVHRLRDGAYALLGEFKPGAIAASDLLPGFTVDVTALFAVMKDIPE
jgi:Uma2 family endonuclease